MGTAAKKAASSRTAEIPRLTRELVVVPGSVNDEARELDVVWTTGAAVRRYDWWSGEAWTESLSMDPKHVDLRRLNSGAPVLMDHSSYNQVGGVVRGSARVEGDRGLARLRFSRRPEVDGLWADIRDGIREKFSVGYDVFKYDEVYRDGKLVSRTAVAWEPAEVSTVAMPADIGAEVMRGTRSAKGPKNPCAFFVRSGTPMKIKAGAAKHIRMTSDEKITAITEILGDASYDLSTEEGKKAAAMAVVLKLSEEPAAEPAAEGEMADAAAAAADPAAVVEAARAAAGLPKDASAEEIVGALRGLATNAGALRSLQADLAEVKASEGLRLLDAAVKTRADGGTGQISPANRKYWEGELAQPGGLARLRGFLATAAPVDTDPAVTPPAARTSTPAAGGNPATPIDPKAAINDAMREHCRKRGYDEKGLEAFAAGWVKRYGATPFKAA